MFIFILGLIFWFIFTSKFGLTFEFILELSISLIILILFILLLVLLTLLLFSCIDDGVLIFISLILLFWLLSIFILFEFSFSLTFTLLLILFLLYLYSISLAFFIWFGWISIFVILLGTFWFWLLSLFLVSKLIGSILLHAVLNFCSNLSFLAVLCSNSDANSFIILSFCSKRISFIKNLLILFPLLSDINDTLFSELNLLVFSLFTEFLTSDIVEASSINDGFESVFVLLLS